MKPKKPYVKPQIKQVDLVPQEGVLANCKTSSGTNRRSGKCQSLSTCPSNTIGS